MVERPPFLSDAARRFNKGQAKVLALGGNIHDLFADGQRLEHPPRLLRDKLVGARPYYHYLRAQRPHSLCPGKRPAPYGMLGYAGAPD